MPTGFKVIVRAPKGTYGGTRARSVSVATDFPRFEASGNDLCCDGDLMQTRWFYMQFVAEARSKHNGQHWKPSMFLALKIRSRAKVVKFAVFQRHEDRGRSGTRVSVFEAMMLPISMPRTFGRWLMRNEQDAQDVVRKRICVRSNHSVGSMAPMNGHGCSLLLGIPLNSAQKESAADLR